MFMGPVFVQPMTANVLRSLPPHFPIVSLKLKDLTLGPVLPFRLASFMSGSVSFC